MSETLPERWLARLLRLPPPPEPPWGAPDSVRVFHAGPGFLNMRLAEWAWKQASTLAFLLLGVFGLDFVSFGFFDELDELMAIPFLWWLGPFSKLETLILTIFPIQLIGTFFIVLLDYHQRWYLITDRSLRIREGVLRVREMTLSFANIQQVSLRQGPVQRLFRVADIEVRTAGGGNQEASSEDSTSMHIGLLRGIEDPAAVQQQVLARWRDLRREQGDAERPDREMSETFETTIAALEKEAKALAESARRSSPRAVASP